MNPLRSPDHDAYGRRLAIATSLAAGLLGCGLLFGPVLPIEPYELTEDATDLAWIRPQPIQLLRVEKTTRRATDLEPQALLPDVEADAFFGYASAPAIDEPAQGPQRVSTSFDFVPLTGLAQRALFRMEPVLDELPRSLDLKDVVVVKVRLTDKGNVAEAKVTKGLEWTLDQQALQAAWQYQYAAKEEGERPDWITLPYEFLDRP